MPNGKIRSDVSFVVAVQRVPTLSEEPVKSLGRVFNDSPISPIKTKKATQLGKLLKGCRYRRGTITGKVQGMVVPVCASSNAAVAIDDL